MRKILMSLLFVLITTLSSVAQTIPDELAILKAKFEKKAGEKNSGINALNKNYLGALNRLSGEEGKTGELDRVLEIKKEIEAFDDGNNFSAEAFKKRTSESIRLKNLQEMYLRTHEKFDAEAETAYSKLVAIYVTQLQALEKQFTKNQRIDDAIMVKAERESVSVVLASDAATAGRGKPFKARAHFVAKTELEIYLNGKKVRFRNKSDSTSYVDGSSNPIEIAVGDVIALRQRGDATFRGVIFGIKATDDSKHIEFPASAFRLIASGDEFDPKIVTASIIADKTHATVDKFDGDGIMAALWSAHDIQNCEFIRPPERGPWAVFGAVITNRMIADQ